MVFNSIEFLIFGILFFLLWPLFRVKDLSRWSFITIASFIFYGWWDWRFLFLIVFSGLVDFVAGIQMVRHPNRKKTWLIFSLIANLGSLSIFKYSEFFAGFIQDVLLIFNISIDLVSRIPEFALILPVGISFYTFQSLSYTIDIYRNRLQPTNHLLHFFSYLSMFPQLVAGPIIRAKHFLEQLKKYKIPSGVEKWNALKMITFGLFQKMVIADNLSYFIDSAYSNGSNLDGTFYWWMVSIAFSFQIYCDFSGYSLIARGLAKYMGYHFKMNFNHPYLSRSLKEFWSRWHISLSTWFRDYVYIPLGGSRKGLLMGILALSITMLLSGLWHGANYTFIIWAGLHTILLIFERLTKWTRWSKLPDVLLIIVIFIQATIAWVFFRSEDLEQAKTVLSKLLIFKETNMLFTEIYYNALFYLYMAIAIEAVIFLSRKYTIILRSYKRYNMDVLFVAVSIVLILFFKGQGQQFIYFQF